MNSKILIVVSDYYKDISSHLCEGAIRFLKENNITYDIITVPGSLEISLAIKKYIVLNKYDGYIALGCIIKGETYHFELISNECSRSLNLLSLEFLKPIGFGIITCNNINEALDRADLNKRNKGKEAANACIEMINLMKNT